MMSSVEGVYRDGKVELAERPDELREGTRVIVTFLQNGSIDLQALGWSSQQAAEVRNQLASFSEEWDSPEMSAYDNYHAAKSKT
jgi:hypothetical protein